MGTLFVEIIIISNRIRVRRIIFAQTWRFSDSIAVYGMVDHISKTGSVMHNMEPSRKAIAIRYAVISAISPKYMLEANTGYFFNHTCSTSAAIRLGLASSIIARLLVSRSTRQFKINYIQ